jgi:dephospho-CoA kinase
MNLPLIVIGLTGGIASGKSTIAAFLREAGVPVIDADQLGRMVLEKDTETFVQVVALFGEDILDAAGCIDRQALGAKVFDNNEARTSLESITHPAIAALAKRGLSLIQERGERLAVYEAALLVETGIYKNLAALVVVSCKVETQMARLIQRDGLTNPAAAARIASQYPLEEKLKAADYVIDTEGSLTETKFRTLEVLEKLKNRLLLH